MSEQKTPGQIAYEQDVARDPAYHDGTPRKTWDQLSGPMKWTWERADPQSSSPSGDSR